MLETEDFQIIRWFPNQRSVVFILTHLKHFRFTRVAFISAIIILALTAAGGGTSEKTVDAGCTGLEVPQNQEGLIRRDKAEDMATEFLAMSAPEVSGTEIEKVWASCLTTLRSYEKDLLRRNDSTAPDTPVWIVEVKGISRPAGISAANAGDPYHYALAVMKAETGDTFAQLRRREPLMKPEVKVHQ